MPGSGCDMQFNGCDCLGLSCGMSAASNEWMGILPGHLDGVLDAWDPGGVFLMWFCPGTYIGGFCPGTWRGSGWGSGWPGHLHSEPHPGAQANPIHDWHSFPFHPQERPRQSHSFNCMSHPLPGLAPPLFTFAWVGAWWVNAQGHVSRFLTGIPFHMHGPGYEAKTFL